MKYKDYEIQDLIRDGHFRNSVLNPDEQSRQFWAEWASQSVSNGAKYEKARMILLALFEKFDDAIPDQEVEKRVKQITTSSFLNKSGKSRSSFWTVGRRYAAAAGLVLMAGLAFWSYSSGYLSGESRKSGGVLSDDNSGISALNRDWAASSIVVRENKTTDNLTLMLDDSTVVTLLPGSRLEFPSTFSGESRDVVLRGDAFFDVTSNPRAPFFVYAHQTVVKVLGTSFRVIAHEQDEKVTVKVLSGSVSVFSSADFSGNTKATRMVREGVLLKPNQELVLNQNKKTVETSRIITQLEKSKIRRPQELIFDDTPIANVFQELERTYGMEIEFDQEKFSKCPITTYFKEESLLEKINTICEAVGASYRPENGKIVVTGIDCTGNENNQ